MSATYRHSRIASQLTESGSRLDWYLFNWVDHPFGWMGWIDLLFQWCWECCHQLWGILGSDLTFWPLVSILVDIFLPTLGECLYIYFFLMVLWCPVDFVAKTLFAEPVLLRQSKSLFAFPSSHPCPSLPTMAQALANILLTASLLAVLECTWQVLSRCPMFASSFP